jgi:hypothetical protein
LDLSEEFHFSSWFFQYYCRARASSPLVTPVKSGARGLLISGGVMLKGVKAPQTPTICSSAGQYVVPCPNDPGDSIYIGNWAVDANILYHRHPKEPGEDVVGDSGVMEYDVTDRVCWKCKARCSDSVWFIHKMYQL